MKKVPIYFYYLDARCSRIKEDGAVHTLDEFMVSFSSMLDDLSKQDLIDRKHDFISDEKVIWLDSYTDLNDGNYDLVFKSAKYNHVRSVIDTECMKERGAIKTHRDGDEEKTHLCIRYKKGQPRFICLHESNYYGMAIGRIIRYLNEVLDKYLQKTGSNLRWLLEKEILPCDDFLEELRKMSKISLLTVTIERNGLQNDFLNFADRDDISDTIDIAIKKVKRNKNIPQSLIREYYGDMQNTGNIKRIVAEGSNQTGAFRLDSELMKMKQHIPVEVSATGEVLSGDFFQKAQGAIDRLRGNDENAVSAVK